MALPGGGMFAMTWRGIAAVWRRRQEGQGHQGFPAPIIFGVRLTDEQVEQIKDGQPVYIEEMQYEGKTFNGYLVMDDIRI